MLGEKVHVSRDAVCHAGPDPLISVECRVRLANTLSAVLSKKEAFSYFYIKRSIFMGIIGSFKSNLIVYRWK